MKIILQVILGTCLTVLLTAFNPNYTGKVNTINRNKANIEFPEIGTIKPRNAKNIKSNNWSVGAETMDRDYTIYDNWKEYLGPLGVKKARLQAGWAKTEKEKGVYNWAWLDHIIFDMVDRGIEPWMNVSYGNPNYDGGTRLGASMPRTEEAIEAWTRWVSGMANRYKGYIDEWEIWNEGAHGGNTMDIYMNLFIPAAEAIREVQPDTYFKQWCQKNFGNAAREAEKAYRKYFQSYVVDEPGRIRNGDRAATPMLLDGTTIHRTRGLLKDLNDKLNSEKPEKLTGQEKERLEYYMKKLREQKSRLETAGQLAKQAEANMKDDDRRFFRQNLVSHQKIMHGLTVWLETVILSHYAMEEEDIEKVADELLKSEEAIKEIREGQMINTQGEKWKWWYWGDRKMDIPANKKLWESVLLKAGQSI